MTLVFCKMAGIHAEHFKSRLNLWKHWHPKKFKIKNLRSWHAFAIFSICVLLGALNVKVLSLIYGPRNRLLKSRQIE